MPLYGLLSFPLTPFTPDDEVATGVLARCKAPVLLIHGADDRETPPAHSQRIFEALSGPRRLLLVPGAGHNQSLNAPAAWVDIERWVEESLEIVDRRVAGTGLRFGRLRL